MLLTESFSTAGGRGSDPPDREPRPHGAYRYVIPVVGAGAIGIALMNSLGVTREVSSLVSPGLTILGAAALGGSVAYYAWHRRRKALESKGDLPVAEPFRPQAAVNHPGARVHDSPHSGIGRAHASVLFPGGSDLWTHWIVARAPHLGAELVGPEPQTAYVVPRGDTPPDWLARDRDIIFIGAPIPPRLRSDGGVPLPSGAPAPFDTNPGAALPTEAAEPLRSLPYSPSELDRLFPPIAPDEQVPSTAEPSSGALTTAPAPATPMAASQLIDPWSDLAAFPAASAPTAGGAFDHRVDVAGFGVGAPSPVAGVTDQLAIETRPPHRTGGHHAEFERGVRRPRHRPPWFCADCCESVSDLRTWGPCTTCWKPMCRHCLAHSFLTGAAGECEVCHDVFAAPG